MDLTSANPRERHMKWILIILVVLAVIFIAQKVLAGRR